MSNLFYCDVFQPPVIKTCCITLIKYYSQHWCGTVCAVCVHCAVEESLTVTKAVSLPAPQQ